MDQKEQNFDEILPQFKQTLSSHGLDTTKRDDTQWREVVTEIQPLFNGYGGHAAEGGGTYGR